MINGGRFVGLVLVLALVLVLGGLVVVGWEAGIVGLLGCCCPWLGTWFPCGADPPCWGAKPPYYLPGPIPPCFCSKPPCC